MPKKCQYHDRIDRSKAVPAVLAYREQRESAAKRGYGRRWQRASKAYLAEHPLCECADCASQGLTTMATVVDHVIPHRGDMELFWDVSNWQAMAKRCHDRKTATKDGAFGRVASRGVA